jgi:hypothetical protein
MLAETPLVVDVRPNPPELFVNVAAELVDPVFTSTTSATDAAPAVPPMLA